MITNYFKIWCPKTREQHFVFFRDSSPTEVADAYNRVSDLAMQIGGRVSICYAAIVPGAWSNVPIVASTH